MPRARRGARSACQVERHAFSWIDTSWIRSRPAQREAPCSLMPLLCLFHRDVLGNVAIGVFEDQIASRGELGEKSLVMRIG